MHKRAIVYARVSTDDQADKGYSLPSQIDLCREYANRLGYEVVAELREDFSGGTPIAERPEGKKLVAMLKAHEADAVIVYQVDRLSREIVNLLATVQMWLHAGVEVHTCDIGKVESELDIVLVIKGWQGSDERKKIRERTMRGRYTKAKEGKVVGGRAAPYGYQFDFDLHGKTHALLIYEPEARVVRLIYNWYVDGDEHGHKLACGAIARRLTVMGVPTPGISRKRYARKRGDTVWSTSQVYDILRREVYAGVWWYGARIGITRTYRPRDEQIAVSVPAIIDRRTWERAQTQRQRNSELSPRNVRHTYLLRGMIACGECGKAMCGTRTRGYLYYGCTFKNNHHAGLEPSCKAKAIRADKAETEAWNDVEAAMRNAAKFERLLRAAQQKERDRDEPLLAELRTIEGMIEKTDQEASELAETMRMAKGKVREKLESKQDEINARYERLTNQRDEINANIGVRHYTDDAIDEMLQFAADVREGMDNPTFDDKRRMLERLRAKATVTRGEVSVSIVPSLS